MKMVAARPKDRADLAMLLGQLGIASAEEAADLTIEVYGDHHELPDRDELILTARSVLSRHRRVDPPRRTGPGRAPPGTSAGGQFTSHPHAEPDIGL